MDHRSRKVQASDARTVTLVTLGSSIRPSGATEIASLGLRSCAFHDSIPPAFGTMHWWVYDLSGTLDHHRQSLEMIHIEKSADCGPLDVK